MTLTATVALLGALAAAQPVGQSRDTRTPQTDQTVPVTRGTRLLVDNFAGEVVIRTWDKDAVHVVARHFPRAQVSIKTGESTLSVISSRRTAGSVDFEIAVPAWMAVKVDGEFNFVDVQGTQADVSVSTVRGDIVIHGGSGFISARSVQGAVSIEGARGKISASSVNERVSITASGGEIVADTTNGDVSFDRVDTTSVDATTINGNITFDGVPAPRGQYRLSTHNGNIIVAVPETSNVTFNVRTYKGDFTSALPTTGPAAGRVRGGRRVSFTLGSGSAEMELESFGGEIQLRRPGTIRSKTEMRD